MKITLWNSLTDTSGHQVELAWGQLCERLSTWQAWLSDAHPGWSPATFTDNQRSSETVRAVYALALDFDHGETIAGTEEKLQELKLEAMVHTSRSHEPDKHRFRVVVPLSRPVSAFEFGELWLRVAPQFGSVDGAPKDPGRFWYLPGSADRETFYAERHAGELLDVDAWLRRPVQQTRSANRLRRPTTNVAERARRYLAKMPEAISGQSGHKSTFRAACVLTRGFDLSDDEALAILEQDYNPRCQPPWKRRELVHKVESARAQGRIDVGAMLTDDTYQPNWDDHLETPIEASQRDIERKAIQSKPPAEVREDDPSERWRVVCFRDACEAVLDEVTAGERTRGCPTGNWEIDAAIGGIRSEHVISLGGGTSWGKSSWAVMVADVNLMLNNGVLIVGTEDSKGMYARRIIARRSGVNAVRLRDNTCQRDEVEAIARMVAASNNDPFLLPAVGMPAEQIARGIRELVPALGIKVVIVDYVQRIRLRERTQDRRNEVTRVAELMSDAIKNSGAGGVLLSQLKRLDGREPTMEDLKETGDLENISEHVLVGWRVGSERETERWIKLEKNKDGPVGGKVLMPFDRKTASFETVPEPPPEPSWHDRHSGGFSDADFDK